MKLVTLTSVLLCSILFTNVNAQKSPENLNAAGPSKFSIWAGLGTANYYGDLIKSSKPFVQSSFSFSLGTTYDFTKKIAGKFNFGVEKLKGADGKAGGAHKDRNLSFKTNVIDLSLAAQYTILDLERYSFSPYISAGAGVLFFNPYTNDASGNRQYLRELNTEGEGLPGFKGQYKKTAIEFPLGFGIKYPLNPRITLMLDLNYRITNTDYLDDVSLNGYPDKATLDARNPLTSKFTYRGNEVNAGPYPTNLALPRGNPKNKDGYYTTQLKVSINL